MSTDWKPAVLGTFRPTDTCAGHHPTQSARALGGVAVLLRLRCAALTPQARVVGDEYRNNAPGGHAHAVDASPVVERPDPDHIFHHSVTKT